jgi:hypothetical protein
LGAHPVFDGWDVNKDRKKQSWLATEDGLA